MKSIDKHNKMLYIQQYHTFIFSPLILYVDLIVYFLPANRKMFYDHAQVKALMFPVKFSFTCTLCIFTSTFLQLLD